MTSTILWQCSAPNIKTSSSVCLSASFPAVTQKQTRQFKSDNSPVTMQPGHTISNQKIILTFPPTNCTYIITTKLGTEAQALEQIQPCSTWNNSTFSLPLPQLHQMPGQNIMIHGFSTLIWSSWETAEMCKQLYTTTSPCPPTESSALCNIWNSHSGTAEHSILLQCCARSSLESQKTLIFRLRLGYIS